MGREVKRGVIVARIKPGAQDAVAEIFRESDQTELPGLAGVSHRSLWILDDIYIHYVETAADFEAAVEDIRGNPLFTEVSEKLEPYIQPYNPETWRSPKDAQATKFYEWEPD